MPPNSSSRNNSTEKHNSELFDEIQDYKSKRLEILCDGFYYDVTEFIPKHPGGSVINYYTEKGEDATQAIQQFHNRSGKKVHAILKCFAKRPATKDDVILSPEKISRHQEITRDFATLFLEIEKEGIFDASVMHVVWRITELLVMCYLTFLCMNSDYLTNRLFGYFLGGLTVGRAGYFTHESGHKALTGKPKLDRILQSAAFGILAGLSASWWNRNHNKHHAMPQRLHHDVDLETMPLLAYNAKVIKNKKQGKTFWIQNQVWLFMAIDALLGVMSWRLYHSPRNAWKRNNHMDIFFILIHWFLVWKYVGLLEITLIMWVASNYLFGNFALSHTHTPVTEEATHWVEYGLNHTVDVSHNIFVDWWMGWLNYQIEHHLFPTMPHFRAHRISERVKLLAQKHGLPYQCLTYKDAWFTTLKNMSNVANQFAD